MRLFVFVLLAGCLYYIFSQSNWYAVGAVLFLALFLYLVSRHQELKYGWVKTRQLIALNKTELEVMGGRFSHLPDGKGFRDITHGYSEDLDLFGKGSFFQYINRTGLESGEKELARRLTCNDFSQITRKQEAIKELSPQLEWRQEFSATAILLKSEIPFTEIAQWFENYRAFIPGGIRRLPILYGSLSAIVLVLAFFGIITFWWPVLVFFGGLFINMPYLKRIQQLTGQTAKIQNTFQQLNRLVALAESKEFRAALLMEEQQKLQHGQVPISQLLKGFDRVLTALDQRNNLLVAIFGNAFFLWDLYQVTAMEKWIGNYGKRLPVWFSVLAGRL